MRKILNIPAQLFLGKGIDKKLPFLVNLYKKVYFLLAKKGQVLVSIPLGAKLWVSGKDAGLGLFLRLHGRFEPIQTELFLETVKSGQTVVDVGANIGYYTILASKIVGVKGKVLAFEPDPVNLKFLRKNLRLNHGVNVFLFEGVLGEKVGQTSLVQDLSNPGESHLGQGEQGLKVAMTTLDSLLKTKKAKRVNVLKIDVEGAEVEVLKGGATFLKNNKKTHLFIEVNPKSLLSFGHTVADLLKILNLLGFKPKLVINEFKRRTYKFSRRQLNENLKKASFVGIYAQN